MLKSGAGCPTFAIVVVFSVAVPVAVVAICIFYLLKILIFINAEAAEIAEKN